MRILFSIRYPLDEEYHLKTKYDGMMKALRDDGNSVDYLGYKKKHFIIKGEEEGKEIYADGCRFLKPIKGLYFYSQLLEATYKAAYRYQYDVVYIRNCPVWFNLKQFENLVRTGKTKIIVEISTYPPEKEIETDRNLIRRLIRRWGLKHFRDNCDFVSLFLVFGDNVQGTLYNKPAINLSNAIDVEGKTPRQPNTQGKELHLLALSAMTMWQGYDRIIEGMHEYNGDRKVFLHLVGDDVDGTLILLEKLAEKYGLSDRVIVHGPLYNEKLDEMFNHSDLGIGTLGIHRKRMTAATALKIRDYMARGLPFVYSTDDPDLLGCSFGCLKVSCDNEPVDISVLERFSDDCRSNNYCISYMRDYAKDNMTWRRQTRAITRKLFGNMLND